MELDVKKNPFLYSAGTQLAYKIAKRYYNNTHFVWCSTKFNMLQQPPTSNPATICKRYLEQITTGDRHSVEIKNNIAGILKGAKAKLDSGVIGKREFNKIRNIVAAADYEAFFPVLYIIDSEKIQHKCSKVEVKDCASDNSIEYLIKDLKDDEFEMILFKDVLKSVVNIVDKKAGE